MKRVGESVRGKKEKLTVLRRRSAPTARTKAMRCKETTVAKTMAETAIFGRFFSEEIDA